MTILSIKQTIWLIVLFGAAGLALAVNPVARAEKSELRAPELPAACAVLQVPEGNKPLYRTYAIGVQIYRWNGTAWDFVAPDANLYANAGYNGKVGTHYAGPTWESNSGSVVVGVRVGGINVDPTAVDWLLLRAGDTDGPGIFNRTTFIHRVNTVGGRAPAVATASDLGKELRIPYTAEYFFYRAQN